LGRVNNNVINEEGKERPQNTFYKRRLQTGKNKTGQFEARQCVTLALKYDDVSPLIVESALSGSFFYI
jgi:hypothetical protein